MKLSYTRAMVRAALDGSLADVPTRADPVFGVHVPRSVSHVPDQVLVPRDTWSDPAAYDAQAKKLAAMFRENFARYADEVSGDVRRAGPTV